MDALTVAVDRLHRVLNERPELGKANVNKRVVLVSNFLDAAKEDPDDSFGSVLVERMIDKAISLEVCCRCTASTLCTSRIGLWHLTYKTCSKTCTMSCGSPKVQRVLPGVLCHSFLKSAC